MTLNRKILNLALPAIVTNLSVPLLGLVDMIIVGHLDSTAYIGAIAVGGTLFSMLYWNFGFLRMGTSGMTSQAFGKRDASEMMNTLIRALLFAAGGTLLIFLLSHPIVKLAFFLMDTDSDVQKHALTYFNICIFGAFPVLCLYAFKGWYIGMQNSKFPMIISILMNVINIACSLILVYVLKWEVAGVACGTVFAQYSALIIALSLWLIYYKRLWKYRNWKACKRMDIMKRFFKINGGIFLRTLCLIAVTSFFTFAGAKQGETLLAVNTLLMQLFTLFSYFMDGFAYAGEALTGRYLGSRNIVMLQKSIRYIFYWGIGVSVIFTIVYMFGIESFLRLLTDKEIVITNAIPYMPWIILVPFSGFSAFLWDGIMVGATTIRPMVYATLAASIFFFLLYFTFIPIFHNHAIWLAFIIYLITRGLVQSFWWKRESLKTFQSSF